MRTITRSGAPSAVLTTVVLGLITYLTVPGAPPPAPPHEALRATDLPPAVIESPELPAAVFQSAPTAPAGLTGSRGLPLVDVTGGAPGDRTVALTFDDGPDPTWTPQVLDLLARHRAVATFCMVGTAMEHHPDLVARVAAAGMRLCSHTRTHDLGLPTRPAATVRSEIIDVPQRVARMVPGAEVPYFRAPGGHWSPQVIRAAGDAGMTSLGWAVDPQDWRRPGANAIVAIVEHQVHPGAIVLLHDGGGDRSQTVAALGRLLDWFTTQGYTFVQPTP